MASKKLDYHTRETSFGGEKIVLYSLDGVTWSTRKEELAEIMERHEYERNTFGDIKGRILKKGSEGEDDSVAGKPAKKIAGSKSKAPAATGNQPKLADSKSKPVNKKKEKQSKLVKAALPKKNATKSASKPKASKQKAAAPKKRASSAPAKKAKTGKAKKKSAA